jgi:hypothetical protein
MDPRAGGSYFMMTDPDGNTLLIDRFQMLG